MHGIYIIYIYTHGRFDDLDARSQWFGRGTNSALKYLDNYASSKKIKLPATVDHGKFYFSLK